MKTKRILALALCVLLLAAFVPEITLAEPSEACPDCGQRNWQQTADSSTCTLAGEIEWTCRNCGYYTYTSAPAKGHSFTRWTQVKTPTCTETGLETARCNNGCGETSSRTIAALGHNFVNGVCTRCGVSQFTPTPKPTATPTPRPTAKPTATPTPKPTVTPTATPTATPTMEPAPMLGLTPLTAQNAGALLDQLRNIPTDSLNDGDLFITQHPQSGMVTYGGQYALIVTAEGGTGEYTYEWHRFVDVDSDMLVSPSNLSKFTEAVAFAKSSRYNSAKASLASEFRQAMEKLYGAEATVAKTSTYAYGGTMYNKGQKASKLNLSDQIISYEPLILPVSNPGTYYCIVRDSAGQEAVSDEATITYALYIAQQPKDVNLYQPANTKPKEHLISVTAAGGAAPYTYQWYFYTGDDGTIALEGATQSSVAAAEEGNYYCVVSDATGREMQSYTAAAYTVEFLNVWLTCSGDILPDLGETATLTAEIRTGVAPYHWEWSYDGEILDAGADENRVHTYTADKLGIYTFTVVDGFGQVQSTQVEVKYRQLKILKQPESGELSYDDHEYTLHVEMAEGTFPMKFQLYYGSQPMNNDPSSPYATVYSAGYYYFHIEDANGRWADSDVVYVYENGPRIVKQSEDQALTSLGGDGVLMYVVVEGGTEPYTYFWGDAAQGSMIQGKDFKYATTPGTYLCYVMDANGKSAPSVTFNVINNSTLPNITKQPKDVILPYSESNEYSTVLSCEADVREGEELFYQWQMKGSATGWIDCGIGQTLSLKKESFGTCYRCVVTNVFTGEYAISNEAVVDVELTFLHAEKTGKKTATFVFQVGTPLYRVFTFRWGWFNVTKWVTDGSVAVSYQTNKFAPVKDEGIKYTDYFNEQGQYVVECSGLNFDDWSYSVAVQTTSGRYAKSIVISDED